MSEPAVQPPSVTPPAAGARRTPKETQAQVARSLRRRYWAERRFRFYGMGAVLLGIVFVVFLFGTIFFKGASSFRQTYVKLDVFYDPAIIDPTNSHKAEDIANADYQAIIRAAMKHRFPQVEGRKETRDLARLVSGGAAFDLRNRVMHTAGLIGQRETQWL